MARRVVLVVEDEPLLRERVKVWLESEKFDVQCASEYNSALKAMDVIVELHDSPEATPSVLIPERFDATHAVTLVRHGGRAIRGTDANAFPLWSWD